MWREKILGPKSCQSYEFRCDDGQCIDSRRRCDQRNDCPRGDDEANCPSRIICLSYVCVCVCYLIVKLRSAWSFKSTTILNFDFYQLQYYIIRPFMLILRTGKTSSCLTNDFAMASSVYSNCSLPQQKSTHPKASPRRTPNHWMLRSRKFFGRLRRPARPMNGGTKDFSLRWRK